MRTGNKYLMNIKSHLIMVLGSCGLFLATDATATTGPETSPLSLVSHHHHHQ